MLSSRGKEVNTHMFKSLTGAKMRVYVVVGGVLASALVAAGSASASADPVLTSAIGQGKSYFTANIGTIIGAFVAVAALLWLLALGFRSMGVRRKGAL